MVKVIVRWIAPIDGRPASLQQRFAVPPQMGDIIYIEHADGVVSRMVVTGRFLHADHDHITINATMTS